MRLCAVVYVLDARAAKRRGPENYVRNISRHSTASGPVV